MCVCVCVCVCVRVSICSALAECLSQINVCAAYMAQAMLVQDTLSHSSLRTLTGSPAPNLDHFVCAACRHVVPIDTETQCTHLVIMGILKVTNQIEY